MHFWPQGWMSSWKKLSVTMDTIESLCGQDDTNVEVRPKPPGSIHESLEYSLHFGAAVLWVIVFQSQWLRGTAFYKMKEHVRSGDWMATAEGRDWLWPLILPSRPSHSHLITSPLTSSRVALESALFSIICFFTSWCNSWVTHTALAVLKLSDLGPPYQQ